MTSLAQLAEKAGVSKATVSLALRDHPRISQATRARIQKLAKQHNYQVNPLVTAQMASVQSGKQRKSHSLTTLGLIAPMSLNEAMQDTKKPLRYYYQGITERAAELGFSVDYIALLPGDHKNKRLNGILSARGIRGIIFAPLTENYPLQDFDFNWQDYAHVAIEHTFEKPRIHSVCNDEYATIRRMTNRLMQLGYKRIGIAMRDSEDLHVQHFWFAGYQAYNHGIPKKHRIAPFISSEWNKPAFLEWYEQTKPDVIICIDDTVSQWLDEAKVKVPGAVGLASLYWLPDRAWLSGFYQNHEAMGAAAVDLLSAQLYRNETALPKEPKKVLIQSVWKEGTTLK